MDTKNQRDNDQACTLELDKFDLIKVVLRSFFIQAQFTFQEKLGTGLGFVLIPGFKKLASGSEEMEAMLRRHTAFFNSHPYLAAYVAGAVLNLEESRSSDTEHTITQIENIKTRLAGILGSLGDRLFWKYLKPFASVTAILLMLLFYEDYTLSASLGLAAFLLTFNAIHVFYRFHGVFKGYEAGPRVIRDYGILLIERINRRLQHVTILLLGLLTILELHIATNEDLLGIIILSIAATVSFMFNYKKLSPGLGIITGLASSAILFIAWKSITA